jgi:two-component system sensor kinase FixL
VLNLLDNALDTGAAQLWVSAAQQGALVRLIVGDDGPGIPGDVRERIFEPFVSSKGTSGLGLYLSRRIVEQHGGRMWYEPREGGGASFIVELPRSDAA